MRKLIVLLSIIALVAFSAPSYACDGPDCEASANLGIGAAAGNIGVDADGKLIKRGAAGSLGIGAGGTAGISGGFIINGAAGANLNVIGGGAAGADSYKIDLGVKKNGKNIKGLQGVKVGSEAAAVAQTGGSLDVYIDPAGELRYGFIPTAGGLVAGGAGGVAVQGTLSGSVITLGKKFDSNGISLGAAGQGSMGSWSGTADVEGLSDYEKTRYVKTTTYKYGEPGGPGYYQHKHGRIEYKPQGTSGDPAWTFLGKYKCRGYEKVTTPVDTNAAAGFEANIHMYGNTYSESYRYIDTRVKGQKTEGMGTNVGAFTHVTSYGSTYADSNGLASAHANVNGGFNVKGGAISITAQESMGKGSMGGAVAGAYGSYNGSGDLGCNFDGSAVGSTYTSVTTFDGMNGSINAAGASMDVSATHNTNQDPQ